MRLFTFPLLLLLPIPCLWAVPEVARLGPFGGDVRSLAIHPDRPESVFLGTADGQIFISRDGGDHWDKVSPGLGRRDLVVDSLVFHPTNPDCLFAAGWELKNDKGWLFRTTDGGRSWKSISLGRFESSVRAMAVAPTNPDVLALGISEGVILSRDEGKSWDRITRGYRSLYNVHSLAFDPLDFNTLYVGTWRLAWKTSNLGKKWEPIHSGMYWDSDIFTLLVDPRHPETIFASACSGVYRSQNQGEKWVKLKSGLPDEAKRTRTLRFDPENPDALYAGTTIGLFRSLNGGNSWEKLLSDVVVNAVAVVPGEADHILVGTDDAGVLMSRDGGRTFEPSNQGFIHRQVSALAVDPRDDSHLFAAVSRDRHFGGFLHSRDGGNSWKSLNAGLGEAVSRIQAILPSSRSGLLFLGTSEGLFRGIPEREEWIRVKETGALSILDLEFSGPLEESLLLATEQGLFQMDAEGGTLQQQKLPSFQGRVTSLLRNPVSGSLFAATSAGVFRTRGKGQAWALKASGLPTGASNVLALSGQRLFCGTGRGLYFSDDDGESWVRSEGVFPIEISAVAGSPSRSGPVFAADLLVGYLFLSGDGGNSWQNFDLGAELSRVAVLQTTAGGELLAGTLSEGICRIETAKVLASWRLKAVAGQ